MTAGQRRTAGSKTLSVVLPNYNHGALIGRALDALLSQELPPSEIIVVDDASTDDSLEVIERFAAEAPSMRVLVNRRNCGAVAALERGLLAARGTYVYFAAADDWVLPGFFALAIETLDAHPRAGLFCGDARLADSRTGKTTGYRPIVRPFNRAGYVGPQSALRLLARIDNWILTGSAVFRRDCVAWAGGFDEGLGSFADGYLARKVALTYGFCYAPRVVAVWCVNSRSVSRQTARALDSARKVLDVVPAKLSADPAFPKWYAEAFCNRWCFATSRLALEANPVDRVFLAEMGARTSADRAALGRIWSLPSERLARSVTLAWLWWRFRPTSIRGVVRTALARLLERMTGSIRGR